MNWDSSWLPMWALLWICSATMPPRRWQPGICFVTGCAFLAWADWRSLIAIASSTLLTWMLLRGRPNRNHVGLAIVAIIVGFAAMKWNVRLDDASHVALLGAAFAALRLIHVSIDAALGRVICSNGWTFLRYILFFPTLIAGPIHRMDEHVRDEQRRRWNGALFAEGAERILYGLAKIVLLAGWIGGKFQAVAPDSAEHPAIAGWISCLLYGWDLYFSFAGYSDVAIGLAKIAGYRLPENFSYPFLANSIVEFWNRWHASLSNWCRNYVAEPIMGWSRSRWLAVIIAMIVLGLWHEFSLRYCAWGLFHGIGIAICQRWTTWRSAQPTARTWLERTVGILVTQLFVILSFAITSSTDVSEAGKLILRMLCLNGWL